MVSALLYNSNKNLLIDLLSAVNTLEGWKYIFCKSWTKHTKHWYNKEVTKDPLDLVANGIQLDHKFPPSISPGAEKSAINGWYET